MARRKALGESTRRNIQHLRDVFCERVDGSVNFEGKLLSKAFGYAAGSSMN